MSFIKLLVPGLTLAITLLCSPWLSESPRAAAQLSAFNIDSGHWGGEHRIFLTLGRKPAVGREYFSSDEFDLSLNGVPEFQFRIKPLGPQNPLHLRFLLPFGELAESLMDEIREPIANRILQNTPSTKYSLWKNGVGEIELAEPGEFPEELTVAGEFPESELSHLLVEASRDFTSDDSLRALMVFIPDLKSLEKEGRYFSVQLRDLLRRKQVLPWFISPTAPSDLLKKELGRMGGGTVQMVPGEFSKTFENIQKHLLSHYVLSHQPGWIGNVPYLLELKFRNEQQPFIREVIDPGKILPESKEPYPIIAIFLVFLVSLMLVILLWWFRRPRGSTSGKIGFVILNPEEKFRFLEMPEKVKNFEFLNELKTRQELRLSSNLNRVNITKQQKTFLIEDKNYKNALLINRRRSHKTLLCNNDVLDVGELVLLYKNPEAPPQQNRKAPIRDKVTPVPGNKPKGPLRRDTPVLNFNGSRQEFPLVRNIITIGSSSMNDMVLNSDEVASKHARISRIGGRWQLQNLSLQEFTMLNGRRIEQRILRDGDEITIGDAVCRFKLERSVSNSKSPNKKESISKAG